MGVLSGPAIVTVGMYFDKRRSLANGLATAGGSFGQLVIPILIRFLLDNFRFQGGMLIFSAIFLHIIPAALLLRPLSFYNKKKSPTSTRRPLLEGKLDDIENGHAAITNGVNGHMKVDDHAHTKPSDNGVNGKYQREKQTCKSSKWCKWES